MKAVLLLSGGFDSPVAGYLMQEKGIGIVAVHFSGEPFTNNEPEEKSRKIAALLGFKKFIAVPFGKHLAEISSKCTHKYYYIISRRMMLKVAEKIAEQEDCKYIITGENIGQVGSQTLSNICVIDNAVQMPILRPILCSNKMDTIALAKKIGTHDISVGPEMCSVLGPKNPATSSSVNIIESEEKKMDVDSIVDDCIKNLK